MGYFNKNLDAVDFQLLETCDELKPYIDSYWSVKKEKLLKSVTHKVLTDGSIGVMINF